MKHIIGNTLFLGEVFDTDDSVEVYTKRENCSVSILYFTPRKKWILHEFTSVSRPFFGSWERTRKISKREAKAFLREAPEVYEKYFKTTRI